MCCTDFCMILCDFSDVCSQYLQATQLESAVDSEQCSHEMASCSSYVHNNSSKVSPVVQSTN